MRIRVRQSMALMSLALFGASLAVPVSASQKLFNPAPEKVLSCGAKGDRC